MALDPEIAGLLELVRTADLPGYPDLSPAEARAVFRDVTLRWNGDHPVPEMTSVEDVDADGVAARVYTPTDDPRAAMVFLHGGGWVIGDLDSYDRQVRTIADRCRLTVASIDYRLAPEHPFPAALDDAATAVRWAAGRFGDLPLTVGGDSAGGNVATVAVRELRGEVDVAAQLLIYPATDVTRSHDSVQTFAEGYYLDLRTMEWFGHNYLDGTGVEQTDPRVSPLYADDLSGMPATLLVTAAYDPLRDEGEAYAAALQAAGVRVRLRRYDGMIHGFFGLGPRLSSAQRATEDVCAELTDLLDQVL